MYKYRQNIIYTRPCYTCRRYTVKFQVWENQPYARYYGTMGVRPCVTSKLPVLRPWFWNLTLLKSCARFLLLYCLLGEFSARASRLLRMCWSEKRRLLLAPFSVSSEKKKNSKKMPIEDMNFALASKPTVLLGFCALSILV